MPHPLEGDLDHILAHTAGIWDALHGQRLFITGGTGFVGSWLVESFVWANARFGLGAHATVLTRDPDSFRRKCPEAANDHAIELLTGDSGSFTFPGGAFTFVIHAATERGFEPNKAEPYGPFLRDIQATQRVLEFAASHQTKRLLFTSSGAVYGKQPADINHVSEDYAGAPSTMDVRSAYGQAKRISEYMCAMHARQFGFSAVIARLFAFVGPHLALDENYAIGNFIRDAMTCDAIHVSGDGTPYRSYLYAADLAIWLWTLLIKGESARPYNVGSGKEISIADLANKVAQVVKPSCPVRIAKRALPEAVPARYVPSVELAREQLGLVPMISLEEGIRRTAEFAAAQH